MAAMVALSFWLHGRANKQKAKNVPHYYDSVGLTPAEIYHYHAFRDFYLHRFNRTSLEDQLKSAIERDDFEEAARIRDLMKKQ